MESVLVTIFKGMKNVILHPMRAKKMYAASSMWKKAVEEAEEKRKQDGHRYFVIWDQRQQKLISITYDIYRSRGDSYQYLRIRGAFRRPLRREELKKYSFYYTSSQWRAKSCTPEEAKEKMILWQQMYMRM